MEPYEVNGLQLPPLFVQLLHEGRWHHPGDEALRRLIPFLREPVNFLTTVEAMRWESPGSLAEEPGLAAVYHVARSSKSVKPVGLPWLDVELAAFVAVNRFPGDDLAIALDYRTGSVNPRVVANDWHSRAGGCIWREVAPSFSAFVRALELQKADRAARGHS
jgi:hypothetical protein